MSKFPVTFKEPSLTDPCVSGQGMVRLIQNAMRAYLTTVIFVYKLFDGQSWNGSMTSM